MRLSFFKQKDAMNGGPSWLSIRLRKLLKGNYRVYIADPGKENKDKHGRERSLQRQYLDRALFEKCQARIYLS